MDTKNTYYLFKELLSANGGDLNGELAEFVCENGLIETLIRNNYESMDRIVFEYDKLGYKYTKRELILLMTYEPICVNFDLRRHIANSLTLEEIARWSEQSPWIAEELLAYRKSAQSFSQGIEI